MRLVRSLGLVLGILAVSAAAAPAPLPAAPPIVAPSTVPAVDSTTRRVAYDRHLDSLEATAPTLVGKLAILRAELHRLDKAEARTVARLDSLRLIRAYLDAIAGDSATTSVRARSASFHADGTTVRPIELQIRHEELGGDRTMLHAATTEPPNAPTLAPRHALGGYTFLALIGAGTQLGRLDHDPGGYDRSKFYVGKFAKHVEAGALIELAAEAAHVHPAVALLGTCAGAVGFEYAQGYPNTIDMANGCAGAAASFLWRRYFGR